MKSILLDIVCSKTTHRRKFSYGVTVNIIRAWKIEKAVLHVTEDYAVDVFKVVEQLYMHLHNSPFINIRSLRVDFHVQFFVHILNLTSEKSVELMCSTVKIIKTVIGCL